MEKSKKDHKGGDQDILISEAKPHYGRGMRKLRAIMDFSQKETASILGMSQQQLSALEQKDTWTDEQLKRVSEKLNVPMSGIDYLASETDLLSYIIQHNTLTGDDGNIGHINSNTKSNYNNSNYNFGNIENPEDLLSVLKTVISKYDLKPDSSDKDEQMKG